MMEYQNKNEKPETPIIFIFLIFDIIYCGPEFSFNTTFENRLIAPNLDDDDFFHFNCLIYAVNISS